MQEEFDARLRALCGGGCRILLAVSGGVDSMTMARLFLDSTLAVCFSVAHVNFSLRGEESDGDQRMVEQWCSSKGIQCFVKKVDTKERARDKGISIEMAARELRYEWFAELSVNEGFDYVAVAHNMNDSAETMFLNLLRGTGVRGLCGISFLSGNIVRPMLQFSREEIEAFASSRGISYRTDSTNSDSSFARNRIRNEVFPQLQRINPSFLETLRVEAERFSVVEDLLAAELSSKEGALFHRDGDTLLVDLSALSEESHSEYWLFRLLYPLGFHSAQILQITGTKTPEFVPNRAKSSDLGTKIPEFVPSSENYSGPGTKSSKSFPTGRRFESETHIALVDRGFLKVFPKSSLRVGKANEYVPSADSEPIACVALDKPENFDPKQTPSGVLFIDADKVKMPLSVRPPRQGDRFRPLGLKGSKLLSDLFTDLKFDMRQKASVRVVCDASGSIVCVPPYRIADSCRITSTSTRLIKILVHP